MDLKRKLGKLGREGRKPLGLVVTWFVRGDLNEYIYTRHFFKIVKVQWSLTFPSNKE